MKNKTFKMIVAGMAATLLILAVIFAITHAKKDTAKDLQNGTDPIASVANYDITENWDNHTTQVESTAKEATTEAERQEFLNSEFMQLLTTGDWINEFETGDVIARFTESSVTVYVTPKNGYEGFPEIKYNYVINGEIETASGEYIAHITLHDIEINHSYDSSIKISAGENNTYTLLCHDLAYNRKYTKTIEIELTTPQTNNE